LIAFRICKANYADKRSVLSGTGAKDIGCRWNRPGLPVVYASENRSLAILELLARTDIEDLPDDLVVVGITIPDDAHVTRIEQSSLPADWKNIDNPPCIKIGSDWIESATGLVLRVPSATNPYEENVLLNPSHNDIKRCSTSTPAALIYDPRIQSLFAMPRKAASSHGADR
jgi:RES domain-containing protein